SKRKNLTAEGAEYEHAHMPNPEKIRQNQLTRELDRARASPPLTEVWSGRSLNSLLRSLIAQQFQGVHSPTVPLNEDTVKSINLTARDGVNLGLLKDNGHLQWPQPLQSEMFKQGREDLNRHIKHAVNQVRLKRGLDAGTLNSLQADLKKLNETLEANVSDLSPDQYIEAKRYLRLLANTVTALKRRDASNYFNGNWVAKGKNVAELVKFMAENGLWFAPASPGSESAYLELYHKLAASDAAMPRDDPADIVKRPLFQFDNDDVSPVADRLDPESEERLIAALLADPAQAKPPSLWRRAARVAEHRKQYDVARQRLERALTLEAKQSRDLAAVRRDYAWFLSLAHKRAKQLIALRRAVPRDLLDSVVTLADRWRAVDPVDWIPCYLAARVLRLAGERELAWAYLTTPSALHGSTVAGWLEVARQQHWQGEYGLAERAFAVASSLEPTNIEVIRERALNQRAADRGKAKEVNHR